MIKRLTIFYTVILLLFCNSGISQNYTLQVSIKNQPANPVVLGTVSGDKFTPVDTLELQLVTDRSSAENNLGSQGAIQQVTSDHQMNQMKEVSWKFPANATPGMYRLVFGQTTYAKIMDEPPQQLDFIFSKENIVFETDFKAPQDSLKVIDSEENRVWFNFLQKEQLLSDELELLEQEVDYFHKKITAAKSSSEAETDLQELEQQASQKANAFNQLQMERNRFIEKTVNNNPGLFTTRLIQTFRKPFRDGYLTEEERRNAVRQEFFRYIDFSDELLINSPVLTDKVFDYLVGYNRPGYSHEQREAAYIKAVDEIMAHLQNANEKMAEFILNYLVNGFEGLGMENVLTYIAENYGDNICQTDEKTTLERKLEYRKMKPGTFVPDFTLNDIKGNPVTLSHVLEKRNLILFWAGWCPHCVELLPRIKTWFRQFNPGNFEIIAISLDTSEKEWKETVSAAGFDEFYNLSDLKEKEWDGKVVEDYNVYVTPTMFLIDENLKILTKPETFEELLEFSNR